MNNSVNSNVPNNVKSAQFTGPKNYLMQQPEADLSFSMYVESQDEIHTADKVTKNGKNHFSTICKRTRKKWVPSNSVSKCAMCNIAFTLLYIPKLYGTNVHHCRLCGGAFCDACTLKRAIIPEYIDVPMPDKDFENEPITTKPTRVCEIDYEKLIQIKSLEKYIMVYSVAGLDIYDFLALKEATKCMCVTEGAPHSFTNFNINALPTIMKCKCNEFLKMVHQTCNYHLSKIFHMQYHMPNHKYTSYDENMLWINRYYFVGHSKWMIQLLRSINFASSDGLRKIEEVKLLMNEHLKGNFSATNIFNDANYHPKKISDDMHPNSNNLTRKTQCWNLMCTRDCYHGFLPSDAIQLLNDVPVPELRHIVVNCLENCEDSELMCYLQLLIHHVGTESNVRLDEAVLGNFLIKKSSSSLLIANEVYRMLHIHSNSQSSSNSNRSSQNLPRINAKSRSADESIFGKAYNYVTNNTQNRVGKHKHVIYSYFLEQWFEHVPNEFQQKILCADKFLAALEKEGSKQHRFSIVDAYKNALSKFDKIIFPTRPDLGYVSIDHKNISVKPSITKPTFIPGKFTDQDYAVDGIAFSLPGEPKKTPPKVLHKLEDVRKDRIIMDIIQLMNIILTKELGLDLNIVTYGVLPVSAKSGIIEIVDNSDTLASISKKGISLLNYALENNEGVKIMDLKQKMLRSCASYSVITFLLGIGDRHLDNIMITKDGQIFHIDYGFVLGYDPKPIELPMMRTSTEMINALGGVDSKYFAEFKVLCQQIYSCLRRHVNLFYAILSLLVDLDPPVQNSEPFQEQRLINEIMKRFIPGEGNKEAKVQLDTKISDSTQSYRFPLIDLLHRHAQDNVALKTLSSFMNKLYNIV